MDTMTVWHKEDTWRIKSLTGKMHYRGYIYVILELILSKSIELNIAEHYLRIKDRFSVLPVEFIQK